VGKIAGEFAEGAEFFCLLLDAGDFANAIQKCGDDTLSHRGNSLEHCRELVLVDEKSPDRADCEPLSTGGLHARERKQAGHLPGAADEELHGPTALAADVDLSFEDEDHAVGRLALFEEDVAGLRNDLFAMLRKPETIFERKTLERSDALERSRDVLSGRWTGRRG